MGTVRKVAMIFLALILAVCLFFILCQEFDEHQAQQDYADATSISGLTQIVNSSEPMLQQETHAAEYADTSETLEVSDVSDEEYYNSMQQLSCIDLDALRAINGDVVGWISIPDTEISYPLLQGQDNQYYLNHTWKKQSSSVGSIFLDCSVSTQFSDFNTIVYGHRMRNKTMFGSLKYYNTTDYWQTHPSVYIVLDDAILRYDIYAAYEPEIDALTFGLSITDPETKTQAIQLGLEHSVISTGIVPTAENQILTLSTCTGKGYATRWVVQAVLAECQEKIL